MTDKEKIERLEKELQNLRQKKLMLETAVESWRWYCGGTTEAVENVKNLQLRKAYEKIRKRVDEVKDEKNDYLTIGINRGMRDVIKELSDALLLIDY